MTWEAPPPPSGPRRWLVPAIVGVVAVAAATVVFASRPNDAGRLTIGPSQRPEAPAQVTATPSAPDRLSVRSLDRPGIASEIPGAGPVFDGAPELTLIVGHRERLAFVDTATGDVRQVPLPRSARPPPGVTAIFSVGADVIVNHHNTVLRLTPDGGDTVRVTEDHRAIPTFDDASVWVSDELASAVASTAARVTLDGDVLERVRLPAVSRAVAGSADGLVVTSPGGISLVHGDGAEEITPSGDLVASNGRQLARVDCDAAVRCLLVLGTLDDPDQARTPLEEQHIPAGYYGLPTGAYSPDGRWVAVPLYQIDRTGALDRPWITVIDTATGVEAFRAEGPFTQTVSALPLAWSPDSEWLFLASRNGIAAWNADSGAVDMLTLDMESPRALAVIE
jgi:hypothetical protein